MADRHGRWSHLRRVGGGALVGLAMLSSCTHKPAAPSSHQLNGEYAVHAVYPKQQPATNGAPCSPLAVGYPDIHQGTPVVVMSANGRVIGRTSLGSGGMHLTGDAPRSDCVLTFSLRVPDADAYQIEVGNRGAVSFSKADLQRAHWTAVMKIGNYTLGT